MPDHNVRLKAKITLAKIIDVAYERDSGFVAGLQNQKGPFSVHLNSKGEVTVRGQSDKLIFQTTQAERSRIGVQVRRLEATFRQVDEHFRFSLSCHIAGASITLAGGVRLERLIKACSGFLCRAARTINVDTRWFDKEAEKAFIGN